MSKRTLDEEHLTKDDGGNSRQHAADATGAMPPHSAEPLSEQAPASKRPRIAAAMTLPRPFDRLASVECQLILQCLDNTSRLVASRCSRMLRAEASHPFSWRFAGPVTLLASHLAERLPLVESSLLRLAPFHLRVDCELQSAAEVLAIPRLSSFVTTRPGPAFLYMSDVTSAWSELLSHPRIRQTLQGLHCPADPLLSKFMPLILQLPHLTSLAFNMDHDDQPDVAALLSDAPAILTSIRCNFDNIADTRLAVLQVMTRMPQLRRLWLTTPRFVASSVDEPHCASIRSFLTSPALSHLTHLTLGDMDMAAASGAGPTPPTPEDCAAAFGALTHLIHLRLILVYDADLLLVSVHHARSLQQLSVYVSYDEGTHPSADVLRGVIEAMPQLQVRLTLLGFSFRAENWPVHAACAQLPRLTLTPSISSSYHIPQDED